MAKKKRLKEEDCTYVIVREQDPHSVRTYDPSYDEWYVLRISSDDVEYLDHVVSGRGAVYSYFDLKKRARTYELPVYDAIRIKEDEDSHS
jgi:hypothetical protein